MTKHTLDQLQSMSNAEIDKIAAECMGWKHLWVDLVWGDGWNPHWPKGKKPVYQKTESEYSQVKVSHWHPTTCRNQSAEVRSEADISLYTATLLNVCDPSVARHNHAQLAAYATPRQETIAAILAMQESPT